MLQYHLLFYLLNLTLQVTLDLVETLFTMYRNVTLFSTKVANSVYRIIVMRGS